MGGAVLTNSARLANQIAMCSEDWGISLGPDDAYLALRGLRSLHTRLKQHEAGGYAVAKWLQERPEVDRVLHPGLRKSPGACALEARLSPAPMGCLRSS